MKNLSFLSLFVLLNVVNFFDGVRGQINFVCPADIPLSDEVKQCYKFSTDTKSWDTAVQICIDAGGYLAIINNEVENTYLASQITSNHWFGLSDVNRNENYVFADGTAPKFSFWQDEEPSHTYFGAENCVLLRSASGLWCDESCFRIIRYICEADVIMSCPEGWTSNPDDKENLHACYLVQTTDTYENAKLTCDSLMGSQLFYPITTTENKFVSKLLPSQFFGGCHWIDASNAIDQAYFLSSSGDNVTGLSWSLGQPTNKENQDCVVAEGPSYLDLTDYFVSSAYQSDCTKSCPFVCKLD